MTRPSLPVCVLLALALLAFAGQAYQFGLCLQDDAFISLRFARHLAEGYGPVYNVGERVEGFTNPLWTFGAAPAFWLGVDPVGWLVVAGTAAGLATLWLVRRLALALDPAAPDVAASATLLVAALPFFVAESVMGLETALFAALIAGGLAHVLLENAAVERGRAWSSALFTLAMLTRPEAAFVSGILGLADLVRVARGETDWRSVIRRWTAPAMALIALTGFRRLYYGDWVPNTFHAKVGGGLAAWGRGLVHTGEFLLAASPLVALALIGLAGGWIARAARRRGTLLTLTVAVAYMLYVGYVGGDYKPTFRFFVVPAVLLAPLAARGAAMIGALITPRSAVGVLAVSLAAALGLVAFGADTRHFAGWRHDAVPVHRIAGRWLGEQFPPGTLIATGNAGALPYESNLPTIDMLGLCDRHIALRQMPHMGGGVAGHEKGDGRYVLDRAPRIILFQNARFSTTPLTLAEARALTLTVAEGELWEDPRFRQDYELKAAQLPGFTFNYFERKPG